MNNASDYGYSISGQLPSTEVPKRLYSVIAILHGYVEQREIADETAALRLAKEWQSQGAYNIEIYDEHDELAWRALNEIYPAEYLAELI